VEKKPDRSDSMVSVVLFDFKKAFDLIDHGILVDKLTIFEIPKRIIGWIVNFLKDRKQRVKLSKDCYSERDLVPAGVLQGTKLVFAIMINDLEVADIDLWKYVDDTTISLNIYEASSIQSSVDEFTRKSTASKFQLNEEKCN
jgi:hypothetical protein